MKYTDTHTHLFDEQFDGDRTQIVLKSIDSGVKKMILPGIDSTYLQKQLNLIQEFPQNCFPAFGLHPSHVKENYREELNIVENLLTQHKAVAIGEIGIDLYWDKTFLNEQIEAFEYQINLAKRLNLPIIIHVREAFTEVFKVLDKLNDNNLTGVFHSFSGNIEDAKKIINYKGFKFGINGVVTFKNSGLDRVISEIPIEYIVLETDSPWLAPVPFRGKRNESSYLLIIAKKVAEIYNKTLNEISEITEINSEQLFFTKK